MNERRLVGNSLGYTSLIAALASHAYTLFKESPHPKVAPSSGKCPRLVCRAVYIRAWTTSSFAVWRNVRSGSPMARRYRRTRFNLDEYQRLTRELTRDPHLVLAHFQAQGIASLERLPAGAIFVCTNLPPPTASAMSPGCSIFLKSTARSKSNGAMGT